MQISLHVIRLSEDGHNLLSAYWALRLESERFYEESFKEIPTTLEQARKGAKDFYNATIVEAYLIIEHEDITEEFQLT